LDFAALDGMSSANVSSQKISKIQYSKVSTS